MREPNPDCLLRGMPHGRHTLMGPGGNKPGAECDGLEVEVEFGAHDQAYVQAHDEGCWCPECVAGKHVNCNGQALDPVTDQIVTCACPHMEAP